MNNMDNNNNNMEHIVPDVPVMRSVALMSSAPPSLVTSSPFPLKATPSRSANYAAPSSSPSTAAFEETSWKIGKLEPLPFMYMLERSHVYISSEPALIANRIVDCFRNNSIAVEFSSIENSADAFTSDDVHFAVRLWEGEEKVLVEVQRLNGCGFQYHQIARKVLLAAKGTTQSSRPKPVFKIPSCIPRETLEESKECLNDEMEIATSMLKSPKVDCHMLGLESLVQLTSSTNFRQIAANYIMSQEFLPTLLTLIESSTLRDTSSRFQSNQTELLHRQALTVLANCLVTTQETGELSRLLQLQGSLGSKQLLSALLDDVSSANRLPHTATQAARCMQALTTVHQQIMEERSTMELVLQAAQFGKQRHIQLEQECLKLAELCR